MYHSKSILSGNFAESTKENPEQTSDMSPNPIKGGPNCAFCQAVALCQPQSISASSSPNRIEAKQRLLKRGQVLFKQGQSQDLLTVVCSGAIKSRMYNRNGEERVLGVTIIGEAVGLDSLSKRKYAYDAVATSDTVVCEIGYKDVQSGTASQAALYKMLMAQMAHNNKILNSVMGRKNAAERLAALMCNLSTRFAASGYSATEFNLGLSRSDIANCLGLAKETISRLLTRFSKDGLLAVNAKRARIINLTALQAVADGAGNY